MLDALPYVNARPASDGGKGRQRPKALDTLFLPVPITSGTGHDELTPVIASSLTNEHRQPQAGFLPPAQDAPIELRAIPPDDRTSASPQYAKLGGPVAAGDRKACFELVGVPIGVRRRNPRSNVSQRPRDREDCKLGFPPNRGGFLYAAPGWMAAIFSYSTGGSKPAELCRRRRL